MWVQVFTSGGGSQAQVTRWGSALTPGDEWRERTSTIPSFVGAAFRTKPFTFSFWRIQSKRCALGMLQTCNEPWGKYTGEGRVGGEAFGWRNAWSHSSLTWVGDSGRAGGAELEGFPLVEVWELWNEQQAFNQGNTQLLGTGERGNVFHLTSQYFDNGGNST